MIHDEILYREELDAMIALVAQGIRSIAPIDTAGMIALGHLHRKLTAMLTTAPSIRDITTT